MRTATSVSKGYLIKTLSLVVLMIAAFSTSGFSQKEVSKNNTDHQEDPVSIENLKESKPVDFDFLRSNSTSINSHSEEFREQTTRAYEEANKSLYNYAETYNETMDMVREELGKWRGDYAHEYNETMGMVHKEMRKYNNAATPQESAGNLLMPRNDRLSGNRFGTDGLKRFDRSADKDTILGPWKLPEAPQPFHKFQPDLQPSF